ncbi:MAG: hypothetical protein P4L73_09675, partial [Caulobacteraceae bacterium]|nr:hypothetical protein [Caulobacteraceae bacterium]
RLDEDEDELDWLADRPIEELVERICHDLGVTYDPALWAGSETAGDEEDVSLPLAGRVARGCGSGGGVSAEPDRLGAMAGDEFSNAEPALLPASGRGFEGRPP